MIDRLGHSRALSIVYFVFVRALRFARREEDEPGDDQDDQD